MLPNQTIQEEKYSIEYINDENKIVFKGELLLKSIENYNEIMDFIFEYAKSMEEPLILDLTQLKIINSSGIAALCLFLIKIKNDDIRITVHASKYIGWQVYSLKDLKQLNDNVEIEYIVLH